MDQNLIRIYLKRSGEFLIAFIIISSFLERAHSLLYEYWFSINRFNEKGFIIKGYIIDSLNDKYRVETSLFKKMKSIIKFIVTIGLLLFNSCSKETELEIPYSGDKMVVKSFLFTDQPVNVELSKNRPLDSGLDTFIRDATIKFYENNIYVEDFIYNYDENLIYHYDYISPSNYICKAGNKYSIRIYHNDFESVEASVTIPDPVPIKVVDTFSMNIFYTFRAVEETIILSGLKSVLCTKIEINDSPGEKNYYILDIDIPLVIEFQVPGGYPPPGIYWVPVSYDSEEKMIDGWIGNINTPEFNVKILSAYFPDKMFNGKNFIFTIFILKELVLKSEIHKIHIKLYSISEGYYYHIKSIQEWNKSHDNPFAEPVIIYSNIVNGMGLLGGASCYTDSTLVIR